jgi:hypothetical protein
MHGNNRHQNSGQHRINFIPRLQIQDTQAANAFQPHQAGTFTSEFRPRNLSGIEQ